MKKFLLKISWLLDYVLPILVLPSAWILKNIRHAGIYRLPNCKAVLLKMGVFPILNHYYEPQFDFRNPSRPWSQKRDLPGIDLNAAGQLQFLSKLTCSEELAGVHAHKPEHLEFYLENEKFESGDAELWYQVIRHFKPGRIFEIGSGFSTLMAIQAIEKNKEEDPGYSCKHVCIEPYERPWLEKTSASIIRRKIEEVDLEVFSELGENDILFIDSSHIIRPQGDLVFEYLELLPTLNKGVVVHVHDIFTPNNYPAEWMKEKVLFWNEQYLFEAFLTHNSDWKVLAAINYLKHNHFEKLKQVTPALTPDREPGSFYIQKTKAPEPANGQSL